MRVSPPIWLDSYRVFLKKTHVTFRTLVRAASSQSRQLSQTLVYRILGLVSCVIESARTQSHNTRFCPIITEYTSRFRAREAVATSDLWNFVTYSYSAQPQRRLYSPSASLGSIPYPAVQRNDAMM